MMTLFSANLGDI